MDNMPYKIAVGTSDGINVDLKFGEVEKFIIYEVNEGQINVCEVTEALDKITSYYNKLDFCKL